VSVTFQVGALCIPTPFFVDYWAGYWIVIEIKRDENLNTVFITLHNLITQKQITVPQCDMDNYFVIIG